MKRVYAYSTLLFIAVTDLFSFLSKFQIYSCRIQQFSLWLQIYFGCCAFTSDNSFLFTDYSFLCCVNGPGEGYLTREVTGVCGKLSTPCTVSQTKCPKSIPCCIKILPKICMINCSKKSLKITLLQDITLDIKILYIYIYIYIYIIS